MTSRINKQRSRRAREKDHCGTSQRHNSHSAHPWHETSERITRIEAVLPTLATKADIADVRADIHKADASTRTWIVATVISLFLGFAGLFVAMNPTTRQKVASAPIEKPLNSRTVRP